MGTLVLGIATIGYVVGLLMGTWLGFRLLCWVLKTRVEQNGMQLELARLLMKPVKRVNGMTRDGHVTWINSGLENAAVCGQTKEQNRRSNYFCTRDGGHTGPCAVHIL
jgi:hypothetical protein